MIRPLLPALLLLPLIACERTEAMSEPGAANAAAAGPRATPTPKLKKGVPIAPVVPVVS